MDGWTDGWTDGGREAGREGGRVDRQRVRERGRGQRGPEREMGPSVSLSENLRFLQIGSTDRDLARQESDSRQQEMGRRRRWMETELPRTCSPRSLHSRVQQRHKQELRILQILLSTARTVVMVEVQTE